MLNIEGMEIEAYKWSPDGSKVALGVPLHPSLPQEDKDKPEKVCGS